MRIRVGRALELTTHTAYAKTAETCIEIARVNVAGIHIHVVSDTQVVNSRGPPVAVTANIIQGANTVTVIAEILEVRDWGICQIMRTIPMIATTPACNTFIVLRHVIEFSASIRCRGTWQFPAFRTDRAWCFITIII